jgi:hypothetical protein
MNNPNTARRAAIYARISNDPGTANDDQPRRGGNGLGVQRQQDDCRALADQLGWEVVAVHVDNDISAYNGKTRPGFEALLDGMKRGEIEAVLCWHDVSGQAQDLGPVVFRGTGHELWKPFPQCFFHRVEAVERQTLGGAKVGALRVPQDVAVWTFPQPIAAASGQPPDVGALRLRSQANVTSASHRVLHRNSATSVRSGP